MHRLNSRIRTRGWTGRRARPRRFTRRGGRGILGALRGRRHSQAAGGSRRRGGGGLCGGRGLQYMYVYNV